MMNYEERGYIKIIERIKSNKERRIKLILNLLRIRLEVMIRESCF